MPSDVWFVCEEDALAAAIAALSSFQAFMGTTGEVDPTAAALARVHFDRVSRDVETREIMTPAEMASKRPFLLVWSEDPKIRRIASDNALDFGNTIAMLFEIAESQIEARDPTATTPHAKCRWLKNSVGGIVRDLFEAWPVLQETLQMTWAFTEQKKGYDVGHAQFLCQFKLGFED